MLLRCLGTPALPALCNDSAKGTNLACIVINNGAVTTDGQPHPGIGHSVIGKMTKPLDI